MKNTNSEFEILGLNHIAMVCKDMQRTVDFYTNVLGMELSRTLEMPGGVGQHFFFSMGGQESFAFFGFPMLQSERSVFLTLNLSSIQNKVMRYPCLHMDQ